MSKPEIPPTTLPEETENFSEVVKSNIIEFPQRFEEVTQKLGDVNPSLLSLELKTRLLNLGSRFAELGLVITGGSKVGQAFMETVQHMSPGHTVYDNPEMFATYVAGMLAIAGAGALNVARLNRTSKLEDGAALVK